MGSHCPALNQNSFKVMHTESQPAAAFAVSSSPGADAIQPSIPRLPDPACPSGLAIDSISRNLIVFSAPGFGRLMQFFVIRHVVSYWYVPVRSGVMVCSRVFAVTTLLLLLPGCALFVADGAKESRLTSVFPWTKPRVEADDGVPILTMARLEASIVTRPANDPRIRRYVWEELDESGLMSPDIRQRLNDSGFRIGVAGSATPWALQSLARESVMALRSAEEQSGAQSMPSANQTALGPEFSLMQNGKSILEVQSQLDVQRLPLSQIADLAQLRDRTGLRCVFEITLKELNDDWVLLSILPQVHAGAAAPRLSIDETSEQLPVRQNVIPMYEQQFTVKLLTGEVAVIGWHESADWNPGRLFFQPDSGSSASERVLMIRMVGIEKRKGQSDPAFRLGAYDK